MKLYDFPQSGNGYKVRLVLAHLRRNYQYVPVDILRGHTRTPEFLRINPNGRIPVLELEDGSHLAESNAILYFLAQGTRLWPDEPRSAAQVLQWMFFEQYSHEPNIATPRFWLSIKKIEMTPFHRELLEEKQTQGRAALAVMEQHLERVPFFAAGRYTIADIALFAYTHVAHEGGFDLTPYPSVRRWLDCVRAQDGHVSIDNWRAAL
jgi:glutathione S-transferase